jgi:hypothetical protein
MGNLVVYVAQTVHRFAHHAKCVQRCQTYLFVPKKRKFIALKIHNKDHVSVILIIQLYYVQEPLYHPLFRNKVKKSILNQGNRSINKRIGVIHIQLKDALNSN